MLLVTSSQALSAVEANKVTPIGKKCTKSSSVSLGKMFKLSSFYSNLGHVDNVSLSDIVTKVLKNIKKNFEVIYQRKKSRKISINRRSKSVREARDYLSGFDRAHDTLFGNDDDNYGRTETIDSNDDVIYSYHHCLLK